MKITILDGLAEAFCPHYCISCGKAGGILCECCKKNILKQETGYCLNCGGGLEQGFCRSCSLPFSRQYVVGARTGALKDLVNAYKYGAVRAAGAALAGLLSGRVEELSCFSLVPLPTIRRHIRERGFDHVGKIVEYLARESGAKIERVLARAKNCVQVGASEERRREQAREAYRLVGRVDGETRYLLVDDVWTTGSSMRAACELVRSGGAKKIEVALLAKT